MSDRDGLAPPDRADRPPLSWYALLLSVLLLGGAAVARVVVDLPTANRLGGYAYAALVAGVALRLAEYARLDRRVAATLGRARDRLGSALGRAPSSRAGVRGARSRPRRVVARVAGATPAIGGDVEAGVRLSIPVTLAAGTLLVGWWWLDPARTVSVTFLVGWALVVLGQVWLTVIVPELRRSS